MVLKIGIDKNTNEEVVFTQNSRSKGVSIIGPTASGKNSLSILPMVNSDIKSGKGVIYMGDNKNLCDAILNISREEGKEYVYIDLNGRGTESFNILSLLNEESEISTLVEKYLIECYKLYLKERTNDIDDILEKSTGVLTMFLGVLKEFKGKKMNMRDLYLLSKDDPELLDLVFMGHEKGKTSKQRLLVKMFKRWHDLTYCSKGNGLYNSNIYFRELFDKLVNDEDIEETIIYGKLPEFNLLSSIDENTVIVINPLNGQDEAALFINRLMCSIVASISQLKGTTETNIYMHNCSNYILSDYIEIVKSMVSNNSNNVGFHICEETFSPECVDKDYLLLIKDSSNILLYPGCTKKDEEIFNEMISDFSKKERKAIGDIRFAEFKTITAKLLEGESVSLRKIEVNFME